MPFTQTPPCVGFSSMYSSLRMVVFPDPLGPMRKTNSPRFTWNVTWLSATRWPVYSFATSSSVIMLRLLQRLLDVGDDVVRVLDADAQAKEAVGNADCRTLFTRHVRMRAVAWLDDKGIDSSKARGISDELELADKAV